MKKIVGLFRKTKDTLLDSNFVIDRERLTVFGATETTTKSTLFNTTTTTAANYYLLRLNLEKLFCFSILSSSSLKSFELRQYSSSCGVEFTDTIHPTSTTSHLNTSSIIEMSSKKQFLSSDEAIKIDQLLMDKNVHGFSIDQLMEMAGMSVAHACFDHAPPRDRTNISCLIVCGPGNNGGDGLVAARHLKHFGYSPVILYPKETTNELYIRLLTQCKQLEIPVFKSIDELLEQHNNTFENFKFILDGIFGFSFSDKSGIREPYKHIIEILNEKAKQQRVPMICIDIPSGWDVNNTNIEENLYNGGLYCDVLISLTAPKLCAQHFKGVHYVGGRFVPPSLQKEFNLELPQYKGIDIIARVN
ncbi:hypothetical protein FDP41_012089 [Naegleria fowleri]|uniref:NAD(P)H-hydrate epimerase n=1 Tax=Naegleria fowleri TaxID=5763 RepID=A0A6A5C3V8_NAEFO|nr:uncharacterized protein FDP41_012089 [Naegleria fowleri]KAF0981432.1 hypothetical protein FDP41_012089 [Naegleria fowleri]